MVMQMLFNPGGATGPNKSDDVDSVSSSPWTNLLSMGLKILTAILGGGASDGIDKVDNGSSPMQVHKYISIQCACPQGKITTPKIFKKISNEALCTKI